MNPEELRRTTSTRRSRQCLSTSTPVWRYVPFILVPRVSIAGADLDLFSPSLSSPSPHQELRLKDYEQGRKGPQQQPANSFGAPASSSTFGGFGATQQQQPAQGGLFGGGGTNTFGAKPAGGLFGSTASTTPAFGQPAAPAGGMFGSQQPAAGGFGTPSAPASTFGGFGAAQAPKPTFGFGECYDLFRCVAEG